MAPNSLNDPNEPPLTELEAMYFLHIEDREYHATVGRGPDPHATRAFRPRQPPVTLIRELPNCHAMPAFCARGALSRPAPGL